MRHRQRGRHFGRDTAHRTAMYRNLVTDLLRYERITTTEAKAKEIRPITEKMVTLGRRGDLHSRRQALKYIFDKSVVEHLFDNIGPRMASRPGGYLRITRLEPRKGDNAKMAAIEFVDYWQDASLDAASAPATPAVAETAVADPEPVVEGADDADASEAVIDEEVTAEAEASAEDAVEDDAEEESDTEAPTAELTEDAPSEDAETGDDTQEEASEED